MPDDADLRAGGRRRRQAIVQEVNRRVEDLSSRWQPDSDFLLVLCECGTHGCTERVEVPRELFDELHRASGRFVVRAGHEWERDTVLERRHGYVVIGRGGAA